MLTSNGDLRAAPATFALPDWPLHAWYAAAYDVELKNQLRPRALAGRRLVRAITIDTGFRADPSA